MTSTKDFAGRPGIQAEQETQTWIEEAKAYQE